MRSIALLLLASVAAAEDPLAAFLEGALSKDPQVRAKTLEAWREQRMSRDFRPAQAIEKPAVAPLAAALKDERVWRRRGAAVALGVLAPPVKQTISALAGALDDTDAEVRLAAAEALGKLTIYFSNTLFSVAMPGLVRRLDDADARVRRAALDDIGHFTHSGYGWPNTMTAYKALPRILANSKHEDAAVRASAAFAMGRCGYWDPRVKTRLIELLADAAPRARRQAASTLGSMRGRDKASVPALKKLLTDDAFEVRLVAAHAVWRLAREHAGIVPIMREALRRGDDLVGPLTVLREIGPPALAALPEIMKTFGRVEYQRHMSTGAEPVEAFRAVTATKDALPALEEARKDPRWKTEADAAIRRLRK